MSRGLTFYTGAAWLMKYSDILAIKVFLVPSAAPDGKVCTLQGSDCHQNMNVCVDVGICLKVL